MTGLQPQARFAEALAALGVPTDARAAERLAAYHALLGEWNERMNLTGDASLEATLAPHYLDSLSVLRIDGLMPTGARVIDVGSGAGFPGLPLAIARPDLDVLLLDSLGKRVQFLNAVIEKTGLTNARTLHARAEDAARIVALRERFDRALARAVAPLPVLCELLLPFVRVGGAMICYKGPAARDELAAARRAARLTGGGEPRLIDAEQPWAPELRHCLAVCDKAEKTVRQYPRKAGTPERAPLGASDTD